MTIDDWISKITKVCWHSLKKKFSKNKNYLKCQSMWLHIEKISKCPSVMTIFDWKNFENIFKMSKCCCYMEPLMKNF